MCVFVDSCILGFLRNMYKNFLDLPRSNKKGFYIYIYIHKWLCNSQAPSLSFALWQFESKGLPLCSKWIILTHRKQSNLIWDWSTKCQFFRACGGNHTQTHTFKKQYKTTDGSEIVGSPQTMILKSCRETVGIFTSKLNWCNSRVAAHLFGGTTAHPATEAVVVRLAVEGCMAKARIPLAQGNPQIWIPLDDVINVYSIYSYTLIPTVRLQI